MEHKKLPIPPTKGKKKNTFLLHHPYHVNNLYHETFPEEVSFSPSSSSFNNNKKYIYKKNQ